MIVEVLLQCALGIAQQSVCPFRIVGFQNVEMSLYRVDVLLWSVLETVKVVLQHSRVAAVHGVNICSLLIAMKGVG